MYLLYVPSGPVTRFLDAEMISTVLCSVKISKFREQSFPVSAAVWSTLGTVLKWSSHVCIGISQGNRDGFVVRVWKGLFLEAHVIIISFLSSCSLSFFTLIKG
jgi:hypothetical protein